MPKDREDGIRVPVMQDSRKRLTEQDLMADAAKVVRQLEQFYLPGEVEATVLLSFRGLRGRVACATSVEGAERLRWQVDAARSNIPRMDLRALGRKIIT